MKYATGWMTTAMAIQMKQAVVIRLIPAMNAARTCIAFPGVLTRYRSVSKVLAIEHKTSSAHFQTSVWKQQIASNTARRPGVSVWNNAESEKMTVTVPTKPVNEPAHVATSALKSGGYVKFHRAMRR